MMDPAGIVGIAIAFGIAIWQNRKAARSEAALAEVLDSIPNNVAVALHTIITANNGPQSTATLSEGSPTGLEYADVDGDGKKELIVQYPAGAHGSQAKVFAWRYGEFTEIGSFGVGTPVGFEIGDFDGDGKIEISTEETDWSAGLPYVSAPRIKLTYRWNGSKFEEVAREKKPFLRS